VLKTCYLLHVLLFYMLAFSLLAYIFYEMDERFKDVSKTKVERNEKQW